MIIVKARLFIFFLLGRISDGPVPIGDGVIVTNDAARPKAPKNHRLAVNMRDRRSALAVTSGKRCPII